MARKLIALIPPSLAKKTKQAHLIHYLFSCSVLVLNCAHSRDWMNIWGVPKINVWVTIIAIQRLLQCTPKISKQWGYFTIKHNAWLNRNAKKILKTLFSCAQSVACDSVGEINMHLEKKISHHTLLNFSLFTASPPASAALCLCLCFSACCLRITGENWFAWGFICIGMRLIWYISFTHGSMVFILCTDRDTHRARCGNANIQHFLSSKCPANVN